MNLTQQVMVLGAKRLDFDNNGDVIKGTQVFYHGLVATNENDIKGFIPSKAWLPIEKFGQLQNAVFPFEATAQIEVDLQKNKLKVVDFEAVSKK